MSTCDESTVRNETLRRGTAQKEIAADGPVALKLNGRLALRVRELAIASGATSVESYSEQILEWFVVERRSGKYRPDPARHDARHEEDYSRATGSY